ncbi:MAG: GntR family transcriptional regulator [Streptosporangiaceae bacterium]|jgi:DNA-binding GntR family transcriptional regulator
MTRPDAVEVRGLSDEIAFRLRAEILDGKLPLGSRLQHEELATRFGVSRTPIREALHKLQALNLVVVAPNRGATVRVPSRTELAEVYELRADLEGMACELACTRASDTDLAEMDRAQARLAEVIDSPGQSDSEFDAAVSRWNNAFHGVIQRAGGNRRLVETIEQLQNFFPRDSVWRAIANDHGALVTINITEHEAIAAALRARQPAQARRAMGEHVTGAGTILLEYLDAQRFWE